MKIEELFVIMFFALAYTFVLVVIGLFVWALFSILALQPINTVIFGVTFFSIFTLLLIGHSKSNL